MELIKKLLSASAVFSACTMLSVMLEENTSPAVGAYSDTSEPAAVSSGPGDLIRSDIRPLGGGVGDDVSELVIPTNSGRRPRLDRAPVAALSPSSEAVHLDVEDPALPVPSAAPMGDAGSRASLDRPDGAALSAPSAPTPTKVMPTQERGQPVLPVVPPNVPRPPARPLLEMPAVQRRPAGPAVARTPQEAVLPPRREAERKPPRSEAPRRDTNQGSPSAAGEAGPSLPLSLRPRS
jgi:hypothetical protein